MEGVVEGCWYLDDGIIIGTLEAVDRAAAYMLERLPHLHLELNVNKSCIWSPRGQVIGRSPISNIPILPYHEATIKVLGCPFGPLASIEARLNEKIAELEKVWDCLLQLPDAQIALTLFRATSGICKVNHLFRCLPPGISAPFAYKLSTSMQDFLSSFLRHRVKVEQWRQAMLPIKKGGLGIGNPEKTGIFAYLSSFLGYTLGPLNCGDSLTIRNFPQLRSTLELAAHVLPHPTVGKHSNPIHTWLTSGEIYISDEITQWMQQNGGVASVMKKTSACFFLTYLCENPHG